MGSDTPAAPASPLPLTRLVGVGLIVFLANAALLVLQLVAGRLLAPFIGSSLQTWTSVIGVFLTGIALGNALGGKLADRYPTPRTLALLLGVGAIAALWMMIFPLFLSQSGVYKAIPLGPRIPLLTVFLCLPAGLVLSLLTPLAIKLGLPDVSKTGRVAGMVFALSTLGCLLGNYATGFVLIKTFTINTLVLLCTGALAALSVGTLMVLVPRSGSTTELTPTEREAVSLLGSEGTSSSNPHAFPDVRLAFTIVFLASFGGMTLELTASRLLAEYLGVSLFTWTGIIGVMLAGTALGNLSGGILADRVNRPGSSFDPRNVLAGTLVAAGGGVVLVLVPLSLLVRFGAFSGLDPIAQVIGWTFSLFFLPMFALGMVSPQVIRLAVPDVAHVGQVAGRVYAWSTVGAIVGTFAAGYLLLSTFGTHVTILGVSLLLSLTSLLVAKVWQSNLMLYAFSVVLGGITGGMILNVMSASRDPDLIVKLETNYYTIKVSRDWIEDRDANGNQVYDDNGRPLYVRSGRLNLSLDRLRHSTVDPHDPLFLYYRHEHMQMEFLWGARATNPHPRVLVIGGGGYTFPRCALELLPETHMDVVEIDPGVTQVARQYLGLKDYAGLEIVHMDGRQFVAEKVAPGTYDLIIQDAVNDLSVPSHLLTKEYNDLVKKALKPAGVYLLTVIDSVQHGRLWKAAMLTLQKTYPVENVTLLTDVETSPARRHVYVIFASDQPLDLAALRATVADQKRTAVRTGLIAGITTGGLAIGEQVGGMPHAVATGIAAHVIADAYVPEFHTRLVSREMIQPYLDALPRIILTDQFAPVDNLMAEEFRYRDRERPE